MGASAWFHPDLADKPKLVEPVLRALARILEAGAVLHPKIKSLKGPWPGTHRLTFAKKERALLSWRQDETGERVPWVHEIGWRAEVYERARGIAHARAWSEARNRADGGDCGGLVALGYKLKETQAAPCDEDEVDILPVLSPEQEVFLDSLLPLERTTGNPHAFVRLGVGPPGSGKTVVAVEAAQAARYRNCDVLVLVPTSGLLTTYKRELGGVTVVEDGRFADAPQDSEDEPRVWVERVGPFFDALAKHEFLEDPVVTWWAKVLELPAIQAWKTKHPCVKTPPFVQLIDALLFDDRAGGGGKKDPWAQQYAPLRAAIAELTGGVREAVASFKDKHHVVFRWERARLAGDKLAVARPGRSLLILVDEAQDLIPAQWQALATGAFLRRAKHVTGLALFGDENQRITPTAFAWTDVEQFVGQLHPDLGEGRGVEKTALPGSFRIPRAVAQVANPLVDGTMDKGVRRAVVVDPTTLSEEGVVEIVVVPDPHAALVEAAAELAAELASLNENADASLVVLSEKALYKRELVDRSTVVDAKGIEWKAVVVAGLFYDSTDFDERARAYTRLTRASERVVLLVSAEDRLFMWKHWEQHVEANAGGVRLVERKNLASALRKCLDTDTPEIRTEKLLMRIRNVLDQAELNGAGFPTDAIDLVTRIIPLGGAAQVPILLEQFLRQNPPWEGELRAAGKQGGARTRVASVLAAGDVGEALSLAERLPELAAWREPLTKAVDESGASALASAELRRNAEAEAPLETLVATAFRHHAADALARSELRDPPIATGVDLMPKRNVQRLKEAIKDASSKLNDETDRFERAGTDRMRSEMGQVDRWIEESVVCRDLSAVDAQLQRLEELVETTEVSQ